MNANRFFFLLPEKQKISLNTTDVNKSRQSLTQLHWQCEHEICWHIFSVKHNVRKIYLRVNHYNRILSNAVKWTLFYFSKYIHETRWLMTAYILYFCAFETQTDYSNYHILFICSRSSFFFLYKNQCEWTNENWKKKFAFKLYTAIDM